MEQIKKCKHNVLHFTSQSSKYVCVRQCVIYKTKSLNKTLLRLTFCINLLTFFWGLKIDNLVKSFGNNLHIKIFVIFEGDCF